MGTVNKRRLNCVRAGTIGNDTTTREVLWTALKARKVEFGVLRIIGNKGTVEGDIGIARGIYVVGACVKNRRETAYEALRTLLQVSTGTYQYIDYAEQFPPDLDHGLKIRMTDLISVLPNLPANGGDLISGKTTINRMRGLSPDGPVNMSEEALIDRNVMRQLEAWDASHLHLRAAAFWSTCAIFSGLAALLAFFL